MDIKNNKKHQVTPIVGLAYALPVVPVLLLMSANNVLSGLYATHYGLALSSISMAMLIAGLFDAVTDPSIGYLSDRHHARTGSRRPFVVAGALLLVPSAWFLLNPGEGVTITYFLIWYLLFYLAATLFHIPHMTWGGEIAPVSEQKTKVYAYRNFAGYAGLIIFALIPILSFSGSTKVTPDTMRTLVIVAAVLLCPCLYLMQRYTPKGAHRPDSVDPLTLPENPFRAMLSMGVNKPALWYIGASVTHALAGAFYIALEFMMMESYLGLGEYYVYLMLFHLVVASLAIKPAVYFIERVGKIKAWKLAYLLSMLVSLLLLSVLLNSAYSLALLVVFNAVYALVSAVGNVASLSLLSDIADFGTYKTGVDRSATYFSLMSLSGKTCMALGISASIAIAGWFGFDPAAESQKAGVFWGLALSMCVIPILLNLIAVRCITKIRITERLHAVIRKRLEARAARISEAEDESSVSSLTHFAKA